MNPRLRSPLSGDFSLVFWEKVATLGGLGFLGSSGGLWAIAIAFCVSVSFPFSWELFGVLWIAGSYGVWRYSRFSEPFEESPVVLDLFFGAWVAIQGNPRIIALGGMLLFRIITLLAPFPLYLLYPRWAGLGRMVASLLGGIYTILILRGLDWLFLGEGFLFLCSLFGG